MAEGKPRKRVMRILTAEQAEAGVTRVRGETTRERRRAEREKAHARLGDALSRAGRRLKPKPGAAMTRTYGPTGLTDEQKLARLRSFSERAEASHADMMSGRPLSPEETKGIPLASMLAHEGETPPPGGKPNAPIPDFNAPIEPTPSPEPTPSGAAAEPVVPPIAAGDEEEEPENQDTILPKGGIPVQMQAPKLTPFQKVGKGIGFAQQHYPFPGAANGVFVLGFGLAAVAVWTPVIKPILDVAWHATPEAIAQGYVVSVQVARPSSGAISLVLFLLFLTFLATLSPNLAEVIFWLILGLWAVFLVMNPDKVQAVASWISQGNAGITAAKPPPVEHPPAQEATQPPRAAK